MTPDQTPSQYPAVLSSLSPCSSLTRHRFHQRGRHYTATRPTAKVKRHGAFAASGCEPRQAQDRALVGVECREAAGVHEEHALSVLEGAGAGEADQAGHHLAGIDGI